MPWPCCATYATGTNHHQSCLPDDDDDDRNDDDDDDDDLLSLSISLPSSFACFNFLSIALLIFCNRYNDDDDDLDGDGDDNDEDEDLLQRFKDNDDDGNGTGKLGCLRMSIKRWIQTWS